MARAWTLRAWHEALHQVQASVEVDLYACGMAVVMEQLGECHTFADLVTRFQAPDDSLGGCVAPVVLERRDPLAPTAVAWSLLCLATPRTHC